MALPDTAETEPEIHLARIKEEFEQRYPEASSAAIERAYHVAADARQTEHAGTVGFQVV